MKTAGYWPCRNEIIAAHLSTPHKYEPFTELFDVDQLDAIRGKYGVDLYRECYADALTIYFKKRGGRSVYGMRFYGTKPVAIFSGWQETTWEQPRSFLCFDKNMFYGLVDGFPKEQKISEESERVHLSEIQQKGKVYKVVSMNPDDPQPRMIVETYETAEHLKKAFETSGEFRSVSCRAELQGAPKLKNFCGPMYDGEDDQGRAVIRYESQEVYDILSL